MTEPVSSVPPNRPTYGYSAPENNACYRHPDRVSYIHCQRCQKTVCPECQHPAPVGVQCSECVASAPQPTYRTQVGAAAVKSKQPVVTIALLSLMVLVFAVQYLLLPLLAKVAVPLAVSLYRFLDSLIFVPANAAEAPWSFLTAAFLHGGIMHILFNGYALWIIGNSLESLLGRVRFLGLFLISVLAGNVALFLVASPGSDSWVTGAVGASGGVFGLFGAIFVVMKAVGNDTRQILVLLAINLALPFFVPGIAWEAHVGGLLVGAALTWAMLKLRVRGGESALKHTNVRHGVLFGAVTFALLILILSKMLLVG